MDGWIDVLFVCFWKLYRHPKRIHKEYKNELPPYGEVSKEDDEVGEGVRRDNEYHTSMI